MLHQETKRLFFALAVEAPWPENFPEGRLLEPSARHMTIAFLGNVSWPKLQEALADLPMPSFKIGTSGTADECLFLPPRHPRVAAYHVRWFSSDALQLYQKELVAYLRSFGYALDERPFLPHVTIARAPFEQKQWQRFFYPLPMITHALHLYESLGNLTYKPIWSHKLTAPFTEIPHTADIAFRVQGETMQQLGTNAQMALAFKCPALLQYFSTIDPEYTLDDLVISLNDAVTRADVAFGCPLKAVSFHGEVSKDAQNLLTWEMVVDV